MDKIFSSLFTSGEMSVGDFFIVIGVALATGLLYSWLCSFRIRSSKRFFITTAILPAVVAAVIALVNGNIGAGIAIAGAFSLVRFRSAQGSSEEIGTVFVTMAAGLAFGMGYVAYGVAFTIILGGMTLLLGSVDIWKHKSYEKEKFVRITVPEDLDYENAFNEVFARFTDRSELVKIKSINLGSAFRLTYKVKMKQLGTDKAFIDELRCRNGNLEIALCRADDEISAL